MESTSSYKSQPNDEQSKNTFLLANTERLEQRVDWNNDTSAIGLWSDTKRGSTVNYPWRLSNSAISTKTKLRNTVMLKSTN
jgi:hypothetical protein